MITFALLQLRITAIAIIATGLQLLQCAMWVCHSCGKPNPLANSICDCCFGQQLQTTVHFACNFVELVPKMEITTQDENRGKTLSNGRGIVFPHPSCFEPLYYGARGRRGYKTKQIGPPNSSLEVEVMFINS